MRSCKIKHVISLAYEACLRNGAGSCAAGRPRPRAGCRDRALPHGPPQVEDRGVRKKEDPMLRKRVADRAAPSGTVFQMRQSMFSFGDDFWIEDNAGRKAFKVDGKALRVRQTLLLEDPAGRELYKVQEKMLHVRDTMEIEGPNGRVATIKKALISPLRERYDVDFEGGPGWHVQGNIV